LKRQIYFTQSSSSTSTFMSMDDQWSPLKIQKLSANLGLHYPHRDTVAESVWRPSPFRSVKGAHKPPEVHNSNCTHFGPTFSALPIEIKDFVYSEKSSHFNAERHKCLLNYFIFKLFFFKGLVAGCHSFFLF
jgi:hypothetical protein